MIDHHDENQESPLDKIPVWRLKKTGVTYMILATGESKFFKPQGKYKSKRSLTFQNKVRKLFWNLVNVNDFLEIQMVTFKDLKTMKWETILVPNTSHILYY